MYNYLLNNLWQIHLISICFYLFYILKESKKTFFLIKRLFFMEKFSIFLYTICSSKLVSCWNIHIYYSFWANRWFFWFFFLMVCIFLFFLTTYTNLFLCLSYPFAAWSNKSESILNFEGGFWYNIESSWYLRASKVKIKSSFQKNREKLKLNYLPIENGNFYATLIFDKIGFVYLLKFKDKLP